MLDETRYRSLQTPAPMKYKTDPGWVSELLFLSNHLISIEYRQDAIVQFQVQSEVSSRVVSHSAHARSGTGTLQAC